MRNARFASKLNCSSCLHVVKRIKSSRVVSAAVCATTASVAMAGCLYLYKGWEKLSLVNARFRKEISWLQWPVPNPDSDPSDLHAPSTRAIELNCDVLRVMVIDLEGSSIDIRRLENEADYNRVMQVRHVSVLSLSLPVARCRLSSCSRRSNSASSDMEVRLDGCEDLQSIQSLPKCYPR